METSKLRLMCSNGGHIIPRPHDKSLCYIGGETRLILIHRHTTLHNLTHHLHKAFFRSPPPPPSSSSSSSFTIKYQLPFEDLDSLISITTDEDLENMIHEYDKLNSSSRLRLFIFPTSCLSLESFFQNSEDWFLNALNGSNNNDASLVNCLVDLDDHVSLPEKKDVHRKNTSGNSSGQDVHSILDSLMMETSSSFGSATSSSNLSPVRVNADDRKKCFQNLQVTSSPENQEKQFSDQLSPVAQIQSLNYNNQAFDSNEKGNYQQPQCINNHHRPSMAVPVTFKYHHHRHGHQPPVNLNLNQNQQGVMYFIPVNHPPQGYNHGGAPPVAAGESAGKVNSGGDDQFVRVSSGYHQKIQNQQVKHVGYYATPLSTGQYAKMRVGEFLEIV
ncbi:hypothetical protein QVD17_31902 [Tagetes erecta]|uniref:PB1 domain-containing protein n=1 Tax=Tagetes erecta TaxID=13708 RepID=A0AAD8K5B8_TARER|nr:hypothetical protein QVD17_31902 [Tagetes erecta]